MTEETFPVRTPPSLNQGTTTADVCGVLLAAGTSSRYGTENKLLRRVQGEEMVRRSAKTLLATDLSGIVAVLGYDAPAVREALRELDIEIIENESYESGQGSSVQEGVRYAAEGGADAVLVALGDMPFVSPASVHALIRAYEAGYGTGLAAAVDGQRGNPVLFDGQHFESLTTLDEDIGGRHVLRDEADTVLLETGDSGVRRDIDEPSDLIALDDT